MSTLKVNTLQTVAGVEVYTAKAWVNFNGTGTVAIRASGNVSSITDNGTGDYTVNFTTAMTDSNYSVASCSGRIQRLITGNGPNDSTQPNWSTTACRLNATTESGILSDQIQITVAIFR